jgi:AbrB family looped-hinge helix DNA binding protein
MRRVARGSGTLTSKGQVTLPVAIRRKLKLEPGAELKFSTDGDAIRIEPVRRVTLDGLLAGFDPERHRREPGERVWDDAPKGRERL